MICDELCVSARIALYRAIPKATCRPRTPSLRVTTCFFCPEDGNFIMSDGSVFYTKDNEVFMVQE